MSEYDGKPIETTRQRNDSLLHQMRGERQSFIEHWRDLADYILPRRGRFLTQERNRGEKRNSKIIDSTATFAVRTLSSGLMSGLTSPARPWFRLTTPDPALAEFGPVKTWLDDVTRAMNNVLARSNIYNALPLVYADLGVFGTAAMAVFEDDEDVIRAYTFPCGSYMLANNDRLMADTFAREWSMTVRQLVSRFGIDAVSRTTRDLYTRGQFEAWVDVVHLIQPNPGADPDRINPKNKRWSSCYYEVGASDGRALHESGFDEFPVMAPRWLATGEDVYGTSPAMDVLGDIRALQAMQKKKAKAVDKAIDPPMTAPSSMRNQKASLLPGDITYVDARDANAAFRPAHEVNLNIDHLRVDIGEHQQRVSKALYEDLFLMLAMSDRREITAREIDERHEEKMLMLGPVLERLNDELLEPLIDRVFAVMLRRGMIPVPPEELDGGELKVEYISILAQSQKMVATAGVERFIGFIGNIAGAQPDVFDKVDLDQTVDEYADMLGVPPKLVRSDEAVAQIRQSRAQAQQAAQQAALIEQASKSAKALSETDTSGDNALTRVAGAVSGAEV